MKREPVGKWPSRTIPKPPTRDNTVTIQDAGSSPNWAAINEGHMEVDLVGSVEGTARQVLWLELWDDDDMTDDTFLGQACIELKQSVLATEKVRCVGADSAYECVRLSRVHPSGRVSDWQAEEAPYYQHHECGWPRGHG